MRGTTISRKMALATVLLMVGVAVSACDRAGERLTAATAPALDRATSILPQSYSWQATVASDSGFTVACAFNWSWQLADGTTVTGGSTACTAPSLGTGSIPPTATGIIVVGSLDSGYPTSCGFDSKTVTKSLNGSANTSLNINLTIGGLYKGPEFFGNRVVIRCPSANAAFTLKFS